MGIYLIQSFLSLLLLLESHFGLLLAASFTALPERTGEEIGATFTIKCEVYYDKPSNTNDQAMLTVTVGIECSDQGTEDWIKKDSKTTLKTGKFTEISFALTMEASMNNQDWRCFGSSGGVTAFKSNSTKTYAYAVSKSVGDNLFSMIGYSVIMKCRANGDNSDNSMPIQWKKDGSTISAKSKTHYDYEMNETPTETAGVYESSLVINDMKSDLAGSYECFVVHKSNRVEDPTGGINLTVPHIEEFDETTRFQKTGTLVTLTCIVSSENDMVPEVTWSRDGANVTTGCTQHNQGSNLICKNSFSIEEPLLKTTFRCTLSYPDKPSLQDQSQVSASVIVIRQSVFIVDQDYFHYEYGVSRLHVQCTGSGSQSDLEKLSWRGPADNPAPEVVKTKFDAIEYSQISTLDEPLSPTKTGTYTCNVEFTSTAIQQTATVTVLSTHEHTDPTIFVAEGETATLLLVNFLSEPAPKFEWKYRYAMNTERQEQCGVWYNPEATGVLPTPQKNKDGNYSIIVHRTVKSDHLRHVDCTMRWKKSDVTDADGSLTSNSALIVLTGIEAKDEVHFVEHSVGVISCSAYGPNAWMLIEWYSETQSNVKLKTDDDYNIWQESYSIPCHRTTSHLKLRNVTHEGRYKCRVAANTTSPAMERSVSLKVHRVLEFKSSFESGVVKQFEPVSLSCLANYPGGRFSFVKVTDGTQITQQSDYEVTIDVGVAAGWNIIKFDEEHVARYECRVQWDFGTTPPKSLDLSMNKVCHKLSIDNGKLLIAEDAAWLMEGDAGEATCEPGYTLSGNSTLVCTNGDFKTVSGGTIECLEVPNSRCVVLPEPQNGIITCSFSGKDLNCKVQCNTGYLIAKDETYSCLSDSGENWDHVTGSNPLGKTAPCNKITETVFTYNLGGSGDCSSLSCDVNCTFDLSQCVSNTLTVHSNLSEAETLQKLQGTSPSRRKRAISFTKVEAKCVESGSVFIGGYCVECSRGFMVGTNKCTSCPRGQFSDIPGQTSCTPCPDNLSTRGEGATQLAECIEVCTIPEVVNGASYPPVGFSVPVGETVTLTCTVSGTALQYKQSSEVTCTEPRLPGCYQTCMVPTPRRGLGLRKVNVGTSYINNVAPPALLCNTVIDYMNCTTGRPVVPHGFPVTAVCEAKKSMVDGYTELVVYCNKGSFDYPSCPNCKVECGADEWQCNSDCTCIKISQRCNGVEDCMERLDKPEVSDEYDCPEENTNPRGLQFNHWNGIGEPIRPVEYSYSQTSAWAQFAACFWIKTSYKERQTVFSYNGRVELSVEDHSLLLFLNFNSDVTDMWDTSLFTARATSITDGEYHSVCVSWNGAGGTIDLFYDSDDIITDEQFKTWAVSSKILPEESVVLKIGSNFAETVTFHGFIKDLLILGKHLTSEDVGHYLNCMYPASDSTAIRWDDILATDHQRYVMTYDSTCEYPLCTGSCAMDKFECTSCDCIQLWQRCDLSSQHCIDNSDEQDCKKTNGVFRPHASQKDYASSNEECMKNGGYLASIDNSFENTAAHTALHIDDIRTAWIGLEVIKGKPLETWLSGTLVSDFARNTYTDSSQVTGKVGLKNDGTWLPVFGLFSEELPSLCKTQGYLVAKLHEEDVSFEEWKGDDDTPSKCSDHFTLTNQYYIDIAASVIKSRTLHKIRNWKDVAWAKSNFHCDYIDKTAENPTACQPNWKIPYFCGVQVELEQTTQAYLSGSEASYFLVSDPWKHKLIEGETDELSICFNIKSGADKGTVLSYSSTSYENEILVYLSKKSNHEPIDMLEFAVHNRVNYFEVEVLDGTWHSVCLAWKTADETKKTSYIYVVMDGKQISGLHTLAEWPPNLLGYKLSDSGKLYLGRQGHAKNTQDSRTLKGSIMSLNVWRITLTVDEMVKMTQASDSFKCSPLVVQEKELILRWRDLLHYSSSDVTISAAKGHQFCGILFYEASWRAGISLQLHHVGDKDSTQAVRFGDKVRIGYISDDKLVQWNGTMVQCSGSSCSYDQCPSSDLHCGSEFTVMSAIWGIGRAVALTDQIYFKSKDKILEGLDAADGSLYLASEVSLVTVDVDPVGWRDVSTGDCLNTTCLQTVIRECIDNLSEFCPGDKNIQRSCSCTAHDGCQKEPKAKSRYSGTFEWIKHAPSPHPKWFAICPYGSFIDRFLPLIVIAECTDGLVPDFDNSTCAFASSSAQSLYTILYMTTEVTDSNVAEIALNTSTTVVNADDLGEVHVTLAADITLNISTLAFVTETVVTDVLGVFDTLTVKVSDADIAASKEESDAPKKFVQAIETAVNKMTPPAAGNITVKKQSVGVSVVDVPESQIGSVKFSVTRKPYQAINETEFNVDSSDEDIVSRKQMRDEAKSSETAEEESTVSISIAEDVAKQTKVISFMVYNSSKMFLASQNNSVYPSAAVSNPFESGSYTIQSSVVGGKVDTATALGTDVGSQRKEPAAVISISTNGGVDVQRTPYCVYWDEETQMWNQTGLNIVSCDPTGVSCSSDHLTNFAVLMNVGDNAFSPAHTTAMNIITLGGTTLSIICLTLTVMGLGVGKMRTNPTYHIHMCLAISLGLAMFFFLVGIDRRENFVVCKAMAVIIHYLFMSAICWMLVEGVNLYVALVIVFGVNHKKLKIAAHSFAWGFPALLCSVTVIVDHVVVGFELYEVCMTAKYCFLNHRGRMYFFVAPIMLVMLINIFIFIRVIIVLAKATKNKSGWTELRKVTVIASITGMSWVFGALTVGGSVGTLIFNYLFIILNSIQGIVIFYFHCAGKPDVRQAWRDIISNKGKKKRMGQQTAATSQGVTMPTRSVAEAQRVNTDVTTTLESTITTPEESKKRSNVMSMVRQLNDQAATEPQSTRTKEDTVLDTGRDDAKIENAYGNCDKQEARSLEESCTGEGGEDDPGTITRI